RTRDAYRVAEPILRDRRLAASIPRSRPDATEGKFGGPAAFQEGSRTGASLFGNARLRLPSSRPVRGRGHERDPGREHELTAFSKDPRRTRTMLHGLLLVERF